MQHVLPLAMLQYSSSRARPVVAKTGLAEVGGEAVNHCADTACWRMGEWEGLGLVVQDMDLKADAGWRQPPTLEGLNTSSHDVRQCQAIDWGRCNGSLGG